MNKSYLTTIAWILLGLLGLSALSITLGSKDNKAYPSVESYAPSGSAAFAELLRRNGYSVTAERKALPNFQANDVVVLFEVDSQTNWTSQRDSALGKRLKKFISAGGTAVILPISEDFREASAAASGKAVTVTRSPNITRTVETDESSVYRAEPELEEDTYPAPLWTTVNQPLAEVVRSGKGIAIEFSNGLLATNRFIDRKDNAEVLLSSIKTVVPPGARFVFAESALMNRSPGLLETIGAWAEAAWYQILLVVGVVIYTLGKRFGLPDEERAKQRGSRELLDAVADTFKRAKATRAAMQAAYKAANAELREVLKLPRDASDGERNRLLPESLCMALAKLELASRQERIPASDAFELIEGVERELDDFLGDRRRLATGKRRSAA